MATPTPAFEAALCDLRGEDLGRTCAPSAAEGSPRAHPAIDSRLADHLGALELRTLLHLCRIGTPSLGANHGFVLTCVAELVRRGDPDAQLELAEILIAAREDHAPGHRAFAGTVLDQLIEVWLPRLCAPALCRLLSQLDFDVLSTDGGDGLASLFAPAFAQARGEARASLLQALDRYARDCLRFERGSDELAILLESLTARAEAIVERDALCRLAGAVHEAAQLARDFLSEDQVLVAGLLERVGRDLRFLHLAERSLVTLALARHAPALPFERLAELFERALADERDPRHPTLWPGRVLFHLYRNDPIRARAWTQARADQSPERALWIECVEWALRDGQPRDEAATASLKDSLAELRGLKPEEERYREELTAWLERQSQRILEALVGGDRARAERLVAKAELKEAMTSSWVLALLDEGPLAAQVEAGAVEAARSTVEIGLTLLDHKLEHPDPPPRPGVHTRVADRPIVRAGGRPAGRRLERFIELARQALAAPGTDAALVARLTELARRAGIEP